MEKATRIKLSRVHLVVSVNINKRERMYLEADDNMELFYLPDIAVIEANYTHKDGKVETVCALAYNARYFLPFKATDDIKATSKKSAS